MILTSEGKRKKKPEMMKRIFFSTLVLPLLTSSSSISQDVDDYALQSRLIQKMSSPPNNFAVTPGELRFAPGSLGDPGGKYGFFYFPPSLQPPLWKHSLNPLLKMFQDTSGETPSGIQNISLPMQPNDALVWFATLPPENTTEYFSIVNYILFRWNDSILPYSGYLPAVQLNDPLNQHILNVSKHHQQAIVVSTASQNTWNTLQQYFLGMSLNLLPVDSTRARLLDGGFWKSGGDVLTWHFRVNGVKTGLGDVQKKELEEYFETPQPFLYFSSVEKNFQPLGARLPRSRETNSTQARYLVLRNELEILVREWHNEIWELTRDQWVETVDHVVPDLEKCLGDPEYTPIFFPMRSFPGFPGCDYFVRDALYSIYPSTKTPQRDVTKTVEWRDPQRVYTVLGLNQQLLNECVFSNLLITGSSGPESPAHTSNLTAYDLQGSAAFLFGERYVDFYVHTWARKCVFESVGPVCTEITEEKISRNDTIFFSERKYMSPKTFVGPDPNELLPPILVISQ